MGVKEPIRTDGEDALARLGSDIRSLRRARRMTLAGLARAAGKSEGFLSKVERGLAQPSVAALRGVADALGVPAGWFLDSDEPANAAERPYVVRSGSRRKLGLSGLSDASCKGLEDHLLSATLDGALALGISTYRPGGHSGDDPSVHDGEEAGLVLRGAIRLTIGDDAFTLAAGDSFSFPAATPHRYENAGPDTAQVVWANTPIALRRG